MYHGRDVKKKINPKENANLLSTITFFYTRDIFKKGIKRDIEEDDIYEVMPEYKAHVLGNELERQYKIDKTNHDKLSIFRLLWACYGRYYLFLGLLQLIMNMTFVMLQPKVLSKLISYFTPNSQLTYSDAVYYASIYIVLSIVRCVYSHNYMLAIIQLSIRIRTALCSLIYRKSLKLNSATLSNITIGRIVTLITKDVHSLDSFVMFANDIWISLVQLTVITVMIYIQIGFSTLTGIGFFLIIVPLQLIVGNYTSTTRIKASKLTDERLQLTQEALSAIKIIKMYTWENFFNEKISKYRQNEINGIRKIYYSKALSLVVGSLVIKITFFLIIITYTSMDYHLTAELLFYLLTCLNSLRSVFTISLPMGILQTAEFLASMKRINKFLRAPELKKPKRTNSVNTVQRLKNPLIWLANIQVSINEKQILHNIDLKLEKNGLNLLTGRVGFGKSSLFKTILEDYQIDKGLIKVQGTISYASEEPWVFPSSIQQNILFGERYERERYQTVLEICALKYDMKTFDHGDQTIIGDRGLNLSKGQQARINLARAIYKNSDIYLLDDCLSSLDATVQDFVFKECIKKFLKNKLIILVSHNPNHIKQADNVIIMENGTILSVARPSELPEDEIDRIVDQPIDEDIIDNIPIEQLQDDNDKDNNDQEDKENKDETKLLKTNPKSKNIYHEINKIGSVDFKIYQQYYRFGGGILLALLIFLIFAGSQAAISYTEKLVTVWANIEQNISDYKAFNMTNTLEYEATYKRHLKIMKIYTTMIIGSTFLVIIRSIAHFNFSTRASVNLHKSMIWSMFNATMVFFDQHYIGNILNRFSKDLGTIDEYLPFVTYEFTRLICFLTGVIILIASVDYYYLLFAVVLFIILGIIRKYYIRTGRSLKRLDSATRSPVIGHLNASLEGLTTIRAYNTQDILEYEFDKHQDLYTSTFHMLQCSARSFGFVLDLLCCLFITLIILKFLIDDKYKEAGNVGLAITQASLLTGMLQWAIRQWADLESQMTSVERTVEYTNIDVEIKSDRTLPNWPQIGRIEYQNVNLTYSKSKEYVLKNINFMVEPCEKIGIVGRTGAGKSSIIATLFRLYDYEGTILIDSVDIATLSLDFLRSNIAIIPQDPILFTGTLRSNIDPLNKFNDDRIWHAIEAVKLRDTFHSLDFHISESGSNFSSGQRQLICLARAIISNNKIIVLDEATANMDPETEFLIHSTIRGYFSKSTVITIAHRLHSVLQSDRVMVVDNGRIIEFDQPDVLLNKKDGLFYKMVKQANLLK